MISHNLQLTLTKYFPTYTFTTRQSREVETNHVVRKTFFYCRTKYTYVFARFSFFPLLVWDEKSGKDFVNVYKFIFY